MGTEAKADVSISLTEAGITIDFNDEHPRNAPDSIRSSLELCSNWISRRDRQSLKHPDERTRTSIGMKIDSRDQHSENARDSILCS
jgi:hypothetical protein